MAPSAAMHTRALVLLAPLFLAATPDGSRDGGPNDPLAVLAPLVGRWVAEADPRAPGVTGWTSFSRELEDRVVVRKNHASYPAKDGKPASEHDDLMVVFAEDGRLRAEYWDNEGHLIRYDIQAPRRDTLVFLSDAQPSAPRFRLTYTRAGPDTLALSFEIAPPRATEFRPYISARLRREDPAQPARKDPSGG
jgi:hypothetical protein